MPRQRGALFALAVLALLLLDNGCLRGRRRTGVARDPDPAPSVFTPSAPLAGWPRVLVATGGAEPALFADWRSSAPAIGFLRRGVRVRLESAPMNNRVLVTVAGSLAARGWAPLSRLGAYVQQAGRLADTPAYLGPNDLVSLVGPRVVGGSIRVAARPPLRSDRELGPYLGPIRLASLSDRPVETDASGLTPGTCGELPVGATVEVRRRPGADAIESLPALFPPLRVTVLNELGEWRGIRAGDGPYVTGYVHAELTPCDEGPATAPAAAGITVESDVPDWLAGEPGALFRIAAGTRVIFRGVTIGRLMTEGWARGLSAPSRGWVDAFISTGDGAALRGLAPEAALSSAFDPSTFDVASVARRIEASIEPMRACYASSPEERPALAGQVVIRLRIEPDGSVSGIDVGPSTAEESALTTCMATALSSLRFDPAPTGSVTVLYPFDLAPPSAAP